MDEITYPCQDQKVIQVGNRGRRCMRFTIIKQFHHVYFTIVIYVRWHWATTDTQYISRCDNTEDLELLAFVTRQKNNG